MSWKSLFHLFTTYQSSREQQCCHTAFENCSVVKLTVKYHRIIVTWTNLVIRPSCHCSGLQKKGLPPLTHTVFCNRTDANSIDTVCKRSSIFYLKNSAIILLYHFMRILNTLFCLSSTLLSLFRSSKCVKEFLVTYCL